MNANKRKYVTQCIDKLNINDSTVTNTTNIHPFITPPVATTPSFNYQKAFICVHLRDAHGCANAASAGSVRAAQFADIF